jgi:outer membrane usher protein
VSWFVRVIRSSIVLACVMAAALQSAVNLAKQMGMIETLLEVRVNGKTVAEYEAILEAAPSRYYVTAEFLNGARLRLPPVAPLKVGGRDYYPLSAIPGLVVKLDRGRQLLDIQTPPEAFVSSSFDAPGTRAEKSQSSEPGLFLNHDFQYFRSISGGTASGLVEAGFFSRLGVLTTRYTSTDLTQGRAILRLDTQFSRDFPERRATLTIGDSISAGNPWARQVYFAGVRYASKFSTQPSFVPFALPSLTGLAVQPSVVDLYVDNVKMLSQRVNTGPFSISNVPILSGQGQVQMVVTDVMGRQQVITQPYIATSQLLKKGVNEYAYEAGTLRQNMGRTSFGYRSFFAEGTHRYGVTDNFTVEGRAELALDNRTAGGGFTYAVQPLGIISGGVAASYTDGRAGNLIYAGFSHPTRHMYYSGQYQASSVGFRQIGLLRSQKAPGQIIQANAGRSFGSRINVGVGYLRRDGRTEPSSEGPTASIGLRLGRAYLSVGGTYSLLQDHQYSVTMCLSIPLGERTSASSVGNLTKDGGSASYEVQHSLPVGPGYGYRIRANSFDRNALDAGFSFQDGQGTYTVEASRSLGQNSYRLYETGSLVFLHGHLMRTRWLNDSFAVVEVPGQKGVDVFVNNQSIGRTNSSGVALAPWMVPYDRNLVRIDDSAVPLDAALDLSERTLVPRPRSGLYIKFDAERIEGATIVLNMPNGTPVPLGAMVTVNGRPAQYQVASRGEVFVSPMEYPAVLTVRWDERQCTATVPGAAPKEPLPRIGPLVCQGASK